VATDLTGKHYRALVRLSTPGNETLAEVGESCDQVPAASLPLLLASEKIALVTTSADPSGGPLPPKGKDR
jgi:hypothetical protein